MTTTTTTTNDHPTLPQQQQLLLLQHVRQFQQTCQQTVQHLHTTHGYSRERAQRLVYSTLLVQEKDASRRPAVVMDPEEIFQLMRTHRLEWDPAVQAWSIAQAVREATTDTTTVAPVHALLDKWMERLNTLQPPPPSQPWPSLHIEQAASCSTVTSTTDMTTALLPLQPPAAVAPSPYSSSVAATKTTSTPPPPLLVATTSTRPNKKRTLSEADEDATSSTASNKRTARGSGARRTATTGATVTLLE